MFFFFASFPPGLSECQFIDYTSFRGLNNLSVGGLTKRILNLNHLHITEILLSGMLFGNMKTTFQIATQYRLKKKNTTIKQ